MSSGIACKCKTPTKERRAQWRVIHRHCNYSAFNGWRYTPSDYSACTCLVCGNIWRTRCPYVELLTDWVRPAPAGKLPPSGLDKLGALLTEQMNATK